MIYADIKLIDKEPNPSSDRWLAACVKDPLTRNECCKDLPQRSITKIRL